MNLFITLLENVSKSRTSANNVSLNLWRCCYTLVNPMKLDKLLVNRTSFRQEESETEKQKHFCTCLNQIRRITTLSTSGKKFLSILFIPAINPNAQNDTWTNQTNCLFLNYKIYVCLVIRPKDLFLRYKLVKPSGATANASPNLGIRLHLDTVSDITLLDHINMTLGHKNSD
jgi:hypothetical protein